MVKSAKLPSATIHKIKPEKTEAKLPPVTNLDAETFHYNLGVIIQLKAAVDARRKVLKQARRAAQDAGITLETLDRTIRNRELEPETVQQNILREWQYNHWAGLAPGVQPDLFTMADAKESDTAKWEHEGYVDGLEGQTPEGDRYDPTAPAGQARLKGWYKGQELIQERFVNKATATNNAEAAKPKKTKGGETVQ